MIQTSRFNFPPASDYNPNFIAHRAARIRQAVARRYCQQLLASNGSSQQQAVEIV